METKITLKTSFFMRLSVVLLVFWTIELNAQTSYSVDVSGLSFTPSTLTINVGDTVVWTNTGGTHNVNGSTSIYSSNPESFGNEIGTGWTYSHVFTIAGTYDYRCDLHYSSGMVGQVQVNEVATDISVLDSQDPEIFLYPNPVKNQLHLVIKKQKLMETSVSIYNLLGGKILIQPISINSEQIDFDVSVLKSGVYFFKVENQQLTKIFKFSKL